MRHATTSSDDETATPTSATPAPRRARLRRRLLGGYDRRSVDAVLGDMQVALAERDELVDELREELEASGQRTHELRQDLRRSRAELRYWNDRAGYVDAEVARARSRAEEIEQEARARAEDIEADAQERSLKLVDRVCTESNSILQHAREEAREMFLRFEDEVDVSQRRLEKVEQVRAEVAGTMQQALDTFEQAMRELDEVRPTRRAEQLGATTSRTGKVPTFGRDRALEAARRFEQQAMRRIESAMSEPLVGALQGSGGSSDEGEREDAGAATEVATAASPARSSSEALDVADVPSGETTVEPDELAASATAGARQMRRIGEQRPGS